jgi:excisionase family DNA binding protein
VAHISVAEAAQRLGVSVGRVHQRIADGSLRAERLGSQWVIDEAALLSVAESRSPGRPLSERSAHAILALSCGDVQMGSFAASERARAKERLKALFEERSDVAALVRSMLRNRAERRLFRASALDLPGMREDGRLVLSGISHPASGIASGDLVEGYIESGDLDAFIRDHLLVAARSDGDANVVLHAVAQRPDDIAPLLLAADLAEHRGPREEARAAELVAALAQSLAEVLR